MNMNANTTNVNDNLETECIETVKKMFEQYPNVNMKQKIHHYIKNILLRVLFVERLGIVLVVLVALELRVLNFVMGHHV